MPTTAKYLLILTLGAMFGIGGLSLIQEDKSAPNAQSDDEQKPLYWVAPMDASYRRDKPGKSPMGMDLVPVYSNNATSNEPELGAVYIAPNVINNLGVRTAQVAFRPMNTTVSTVGYVQYDEDKLVHIHPRVDGWIEELFVKAAGNKVKQGQPLYSLYSPELVNAQKEMLIALNQANQPLVGAAKKRLLALQMSPKFIDKLIASKEVQQNVTFYAPQTGVIENLAIREGFYVEPGTTMMSIGQLDQVWVEAEIFERDTALVSVGLPVTMTLGYLPNRKWTGVVDYVYPTLNQQTRTLRVRLKFDNADHQLKPNMFAQISINNIDEMPTLVLPKESVIRTGKQNRVVLALGDGLFKSVAVSIGKVSDTEIEILDGVMQNDSVVISAQFLIDSESSKDSDFKRITAEDETQSMHDEHVSTATVTGKINNILPDLRIVNISREAIEKWGRKAATLDFVASEHIDLSQFSADDQIIFTFEVHDELVITDMSATTAHDNTHNKH